MRPFAALLRGKEMVPRMLIWAWAIGAIRATTLSVNSSGFWSRRLWRRCVFHAMTTLVSKVKAVDKHPCGTPAHCDKSNTCRADRRCNHMPINSLWFDVASGGLEGGQIAVEIGAHALSQSADGKSDRLALDLCR
jgi:hypothetical protein